LPPVRRDLPKDGWLNRANAFSYKIVGASIAISRTNLVAQWDHFAVLGHQACRKVEFSAALGGNPVNTIEPVDVHGEARYSFREPGCASLVSSQPRYFTIY
jgi:hypothetical protein